MNKLKSLKPCWREKNRYVVFRIKSKHLISFKDAEIMLKSSFLRLVGLLGLSKSGYLMIKSKYDKINKTGVIKVTTKFVDALKSSFVLLEKINNELVCVMSISTSGTLKALEKNRRK